MLNIGYTNAIIGLLETLKLRSALLFYFGAFFLLVALICLVLLTLTREEVLGVNAYLKPLKFLLSSAILSWTLAWYVGYLQPSVRLDVAVGLIIAMLCFQDLYIFVQAVRGMMSHFNVSTPFYSRMFSMMAVGSTVLTFGVLYIGFEFWRRSFDNIPLHYLWAIRLGFLVFGLFAFQGFLMGARMSHTVGAPDGSEGWPIVNWSRRFGDLRVAHFVGMHALQVLPLLSFYVLRNTKLTIAVGVIYLVLASITLGQALKSKPLVLDSSKHHKSQNNASF